MAPQRRGRLRRHRGTKRGRLPAMRPPGRIPRQRPARAVLSPSRHRRRRERSARTPLGCPQLTLVRRQGGVDLRGGQLPIGRHRDTHFVDVISSLGCQAQRHPPEIHPAERTGWQPDHRRRTRQTVVLPTSRMAPTGGTVGSYPSRRSLRQPTKRQEVEAASFTFPPQEPGRHG
jgi:hypothetical protein